MDNLGAIRKKFTIVLCALGVFDLLLLGYMLWPGTSYTALQARVKSLQQQHSALDNEVAPLRGMDGKLTKTRVDIKTFYQKRIPTNYSEISQLLDKLKQDNHVDVLSIRYSSEKSEKTDLPDVQRITIETTVAGDYARVAEFINKMEQCNLLFVITQVQLTGREGGTVSLQIKLETFLKEAA